VILVVWSVSNNHLFNNNRYLLRCDGWVMRDMQVIPEQQLQCMCARFEAQLGRGAGVAKMNVVRVGRYRQPQIGQAGVYQQVMVAGMRVIDPGCDYVHALYSEFNTYGAGNRSAICRCNEMYARAIGGCRARHGCRRVACGCLDSGRFRRLLAAARQREQCRCEERR